jgi:hypothetical protein
MSPHVCRLLCLISLSLIGARAQTVVQWTGSGANNHYYQLVVGPTTWVDANNAAQAAGGYLATLTSSAEDAFVYSNVASTNAAGWFVDSAGNSQGPALGGLQTDFTQEAAGGWSWVTGETWSFTNFESGEPNNFNGTENYLEFFKAGSAIGDRWNDIPGDATIQSYVVEFDTSPIPEPATSAMVVAGAAVGFAAWRGRARLAAAR